MRKRIYLILFLVSFFSLSPISRLFAEGQSKSDISVKAEVNQAFITIGDPVEYTVRIKHDPAVQVLSSIPPPPEDIFKIKRVEDIQKRDEPPYVTGKKYTLTTYRLGEFVLEPVEIQYRKEGGELEILKTAPIYLTVKSIAEGEEKEDIRGMKPVVALPSQIKRLLVLLLLGVVAFLAFGLYQRNRLRQMQPEQEEPALSPEEEALSRLNQLFESDLIRQNQYKQYYLILSEVLRIYLERRFHILAVESTTSEITHTLKSKRLDPRLSEKIKGVLEAADLAKFAKWKPGPAEIVKINQESKEFVEETTPKKIEEEAARGV